MAFWSAVGPEPKRNHRWVVRFSPPDASSITYALKKVDKPKAKIGEVEHKYLNHSFWYPGRLSWEPINMTFAAVSEPDATYIIDLITKQAGYGVPNNAGLTNDQLATIGKNKFRGALGASIDIYQVDANGMTNEMWQVFNPFFTNIQYGALDYSNEEIVEIQCTVRFDWAKLTAPTNSAGQSTDSADVGPRPAGGGIFP
jgi:hypothetical protein